jgi:hypothetical protein
MEERGSKWESPDYPWDVVFELEAVYRETETGDLLYLMLSEDGTISEYVSEWGIQNHWGRVHD